MTCWPRARRKFWPRSMAARPAVLVTRPTGQAQVLCEALRERGFPAHSLPMLELLPTPGPDPAQRALLADLGEFAHIIFISSNAVRFGMPWLHSGAAALPVGLRWHAIGEVTARALEEHGIPEVQRPAVMTSEGLLDGPEFTSVAGQRVLIVKGEGGRATLRDTLAARGAEVLELPCYRRRCPRLGDGELAESLGKWNIGVIALSSGEGFANMLTLLSRRESSKLAHMPLILPSERVAGLARAQGFTQLVTAANASDAAVLAALEQWWQTEQMALGNDE
jgi:uroporphyrinogen-III synthase